MPESYFVTRDYADLQVLSQLAWFDEFFLAEPDIAALVQKGEDFTRDDQLLVIAPRARDSRPRYCRLMPRRPQRGSIELSATPYYHPILPLLCDTNVGARVLAGTQSCRRGTSAIPTMPRCKSGARWIRTRRSSACVRTGLWPSEGSVSEETLTLAGRQGIQWMATDEGVLGRTLDFNFARQNDDHLHVEGAERLYNIYRYEKDDTRMHMVFRDHRLSDLIGFVYSGMPAQDAANHLIQNIKDSAQPVLEKGKNAVVSIILDGENAWEYYPQSGREFLRRFYDALQRDEQIEPVTISEAIARHNEDGLRATQSAGAGIVDRRQLQRLDWRSRGQPARGTCWPKRATTTTGIRIGCQPSSASWRGRNC